MARRMLIDATHPEETRVAVVSGNRLEEFDFETASKKQLKGNIYLARVTRVEPSLQAAFVEYGGNRHGFLAFSEIHPDYYRIPIADREALIAEEKAQNAEADAERDQDGGDGASVETVGGDLEEEQMPRRAPKLARQYKIQEVITRRQVMLVQVTKEERGNKGAALTTYLSLAGRYCVLMPNTPRGGGISRKISNAADRKKMRSILDDLMVPEGMAVILRTAGVQRTKAEIKRDLDYLLRLWESIRELTLKSMAPTIIHEEANLIKRAIRDLYNRDIDEVIVEGEDGYKTAKAFMKMLMPSHAKKVQSYKDDLIPLFHRYQVENQIEALHSPTVQLKSGGYIVINPTEALVAIDVNSGKSTRERNIEETAYRTNLEAAEEVARQLRLRDLAGLIVVDFIDMEEDRHNNAVERRLKEAMKSDRARVQLGRISHFGLLELSRQRLRPSLLEAHFEVSPYCGGTGMIRTVESSSLVVLRAIVEEGTRQRSTEITVKLPTNVALYILNHKRDALAQIEQRYGLTVMLEGDDSLYVPNFELLRSRGGGRQEAAERAQPVDATRILEESDAEAEAEPPKPADRHDSQDEDEDSEGQGRGKRRRRSRRKRRDPADQAPEQRAEASEEREEAEATDAATGDSEAGESGDEQSSSRGRRRGRRGGRGRSRRRSSEVAAETADSREEDSREPDIRDSEETPAEAGPAASDEGQSATPDKPKRKRPSRRRKSDPAAEPVAEAVSAEGGDAASREAEAPAAAAPSEAAEGGAVAEAAEGAEEAPKPKRRRSPRRKAQPAAEASETPAMPESAGEGAKASTEAGEAAEAEPEAKPKRPRRTRKPKAAKSEEAQADASQAEAPEATPAEDGAAEVRPEPAEAAPAEQSQPARSSGNGANRRARSQAQDGAGEGENEAASAGERVNEKPDKPKRGWWRRMLEG